MSTDAILAELTPCGYILATGQYKFFALKCFYCDKTYAQWSTFLQHLKLLHNGIPDETECISECCDEAISNTMVDNMNAVTEDECIYQDGEVTTDKIGSGPFDDINAMDNQIEGLLYEHKEEEYGSTENLVYAPGTPMDQTNPSPMHNYEEYIENMYEDLNPSCEEIVSSVHELNDLRIDLSSKDSMTEQFIEVYKDFPLLWSTEEVSVDVADQMCIAKSQMLESLKKKSLFINLTDLEKAIFEIGLQYSELTRRLEEGQKISDVEENYIAICSFLQPCGEVNPVENKILDETGSEISDLNYCIEKDSQREFDLSNEEIENLQNNSRKKQTVLKFSTRNKITCDFILCLRHHTSLWDPTDNAFNDPEERVQAYDKIKKFFFDKHKLQLTQGKIKSDIKRLYTFYKRCISSSNIMSTTRRNYFDLCAFLANAELNSYSTLRGDVIKKISFSTLDELTCSFIDYCAMHPVLWDKNHANYSVLNSRIEAYDEIALNLQQLNNVEFTHEELYYAISRLKHHYHSLQRKKGQLTNHEQDLLDRCNFLPKIKKSLKCHICERVLRSEITLQTHLLKVHNIGELPYKCEYCEQRFAQRNLRKEHEVRAHTKEFEFVCSYCTKGFVNRRDLEKHKMVHTGERKIVCEHCGKRFRLKNQMNEHVKIVHERLRRFKCSMCPKDFLRKRNLDDHIRAHLNIRDKICNICDKGFTSLHGLFRHRQLHFEKRYECIECGKCFHRFSSLRLHEKQKHNIVKEDGENVVTGTAQEEEGVKNENAV